MTDRDPYDLFEQWPEDDAELAVVEARSRSTIAAMIAIVLLLVAVIAIILGLLALKSFLDAQNDEGDVARLPTARTSGATVSV